MGAAYFYHMTARPLEATLPVLVSKARQAGWRVVIRSQSQDHSRWLDTKLWLGSDDSFLPHGVAGTGFDADQPVLLTSGPEISNKATCLMAVDGAEITEKEVSKLDRVCILFDGNDEAALALARTQWKALADQGCAAKYWAQDANGWQMKAETGKAD